MAQVTLFGTTGNYPSLAKDGADTKYIFFPEPEFDWSFTKINDYEEIPFLAAPTCYDSFTQNRMITVRGTIKISGGGDPPGAKTLKQRMEELDAVFWRTASFSNQPQASNANEEVLCLEITMPSGAKQHFVSPHSLTFKWAGGTTHMTYVATFREVELVVLV